ncbi:hypothetical protein CHCC15292_2044 [Bacillus licheniformis]|nr:hypothetical protein CHCC15292_2044 [Bacillus licheniformis]
MTILHTNAKFYNKNKKNLPDGRLCEHVKRRAPGVGLLASK